MASQLEDLLLREPDRAGISPSWQYCRSVNALPIQHYHVAMITQDEYYKRPRGQLKSLSSRV